MVCVNDLSGTGAYMDVGGRAMHGAIAEVPSYGKAKKEVDANLYELTP